MIAIRCFSYLFFVLIVLNSVSTQPCQCQNSFNSQTVPVFLQPSNNNPYYQAAEVQTPTINPQSLQETLNQLVFGITKSNPSILGLLDQNSKIVSQNAVEIPKTVSNNNEPRVINNYFIVPPEFFNKNGTLAKKTGQNNVTGKRKRINNHKIDKNQLPTQKGLKRINNDRQRQELQNFENAKVILGDTVRNNDKSKRRKKLKSRKTKERLITAPDTEIISIDDVGVESDEPVRKKKKGKSKRRKSKPKVVQNKSIEVINEPTFEEKSGDETFEAVSDIQEDRPKRKKKRRNKTIVNEKFDIDDTRLKNIEVPVDNLDNCAGEFDLSENRKTRNSKTDHHRKETRENTGKINPIPDDILKAYFPYMNFYYPGNLPFNFEQYYQNSHPLRNIRNKKRRKNIKVVKPPNDTIEITIKTKTEPKEIEQKELESKETVKEVIKDVEHVEKLEPLDLELSKKDVTSEDIESFETITDIPMELPQNINPKKDEVITKENYKVLNENIEDLQNYMIPEIDTQPALPVIYNNVLNDYYPIFYDESVYSNENDQAATTRREERRYFYKTGNSEEARKHRKPENINTETQHTIEKDAEIFVPNQKNTDREILRNQFKESNIDLKFDRKILDKYTENYKIEDAIFQPPPFLENPDFTTKNIRDYEKYKDSNNLEYKDKLSVYSDVKIDTLPNIKRVRIPAKNTRPKVEEIETVFANSKVKKYGVQAESSESDESSGVSTENKEFQGNGDTTYVVAKSLGKVDEFYY